MNRTHRITPSMGIEKDLPVYDQYVYVHVLVDPPAGGCLIEISDSGFASGTLESESFRRSTNTQH